LIEYLPQDMLIKYSLQYIYVALDFQWLNCGKVPTLFKAS
jgi:hypothetical protein